MQHIEYLVFDYLYIETREIHDESCLVEWKESERNEVGSGRSEIESDGCDEPERPFYFIECILVFCTSNV
jgi:hypothetical protein